jgi:hypothetical protein
MEHKRRFLYPLGFFFFFWDIKAESRFQYVRNKGRGERETNRPRYTPAAVIRCDHAVRCVAAPSILAVREQKTAARGACQSLPLLCSRLLQTVLWLSSVFLVFVFYTAVKYFMFHSVANTLCSGLLLLLWLTCQPNQLRPVYPTALPSTKEIMISYFPFIYLSEAFWRFVVFVCYNCRVVERSLILCMFVCNQNKASDCQLFKSWQKSNFRAIRLKLRRFN